MGDRGVLREFVVGQRVRIKAWPHASVYSPDEPHFVIGHFGHVVDVEPGPCGLIEVKISHGPDGGPPDPRVLKPFPVDIWPMWPDELEAVD